MARCRCWPWPRPKKSSPTIARRSRRATTCCSSSRTIRTMRACCSASRATRASRASSPTAARRRSRWRASTCRRRSRSICSCRTCWAGPCSTTSSSIRRRGTSRCRSCRSRRSGSTACRTAHFLIWSSRRRPKIWRHAFDRIKSYVAPHKKRLLVVEDNDIERQSIVELLVHDDIEIAAVGTGRRGAGSRCGDGRFDCCVLDLRLPDMSGFELLERMQADAALRDAAGRRVHRQGAVERRRRRS